MQNYGSTPLPIWRTIWILRRPRWPGPPRRKSRTATTTTTGGTSTTTRTTPTTGRPRPGFWVSELMSCAPWWRAGKAEEQEATDWADSRRGFGRNP
eukprot:s391_g7.t5